MRSGMGHVQEQRFRCVVRLNQTHRLPSNHIRRVLLAEVVGHVQITSHVQSHRSAFLGHMIEVILMTRPEAQMRIEAPIQRCVLSLEMTQMPFTDDVRRIAQLLQIFGQQFLGQR